MTSINLKGIHVVRKRLADGSLRTYHYSWRGGPRLVGEPGSEEYLASYQAARQRQPAPDTFLSIIRAYQASEAYARISKRTRDDYRKHIIRIENKFGDMDIAAIEDRRVRRGFLDWRNELTVGARQADYAFSVLSRILSWAKIEGYVSRNPAILDRGERLYHADRSQSIWTANQVAAFMSVASEPIQRAMIMALDTGQRQGDLLKLTWNGYTRDSEGRRWIELRQSKTGRRVAVAVTLDLARVLDATHRTAAQILTNSRGHPWTPNSFRAAWRATAKRAGITGLTFHDIRGTAVTHLAEAGSTAPEIAAVTGHNLRDAESIIDRYLGRTKPLALSAIHRLEKKRKGNK
jgi:integrase